MYLGLQFQAIKLNKNHLFFLAGLVIHRGQVWKIILGLTVKGRLDITVAGLCMHQ